MKQKLLFLFAFFHCIAALTQTTPEYVWWNPAQNDFPVVEGQAWPKEVQQPYDRLPATAEKTVRKEVWTLARQSAGLLIRFRASTDQLINPVNDRGPHWPWVWCTWFQ